jgi:hypothetical protein
MEELGSSKVHTVLQNFPSNFFFVRLWGNGQLFSWFFYSLFFGLGVVLAVRLGSASPVGSGSIQMRWEEE